MSEYISHSERETEELAFNLAKENKIKFGDIIALRGDLGAGKTAFTRGLTKFFSPGARITSPTFSLANEYKTKNGKKILHFDMYRINSEDDLLSVGFYDYLDEPDNAIIIIEWFDKIADFFDENTVDIDIIKVGRGIPDAPCENERKIIFERRQEFLC